MLAAPSSLATTNYGEAQLGHLEPAGRVQFGTWPKFLFPLRFSLPCRNEYPLCNSCMNHSAVAWKNRVHVRCHLQLRTGLTPFAYAVCRISASHFCVCLSPRPWCLAGEFSRGCHPPRCAFHPMSFSTCWPRAAPERDACNCGTAPQRSCPCDGPVLLLNVLSRWHPSFPP